MKELSEFLGADLDEITIEKIANHCSFENLKNVKTFDLSARLKESDNSIIFKIMRVSYFVLKILQYLIPQTVTAMSVHNLCWYFYVNNRISTS